MVSLRLRFATQDPQESRITLVDRHLVAFQLLSLVSSGGGESKGPCMRGHDLWKLGNSESRWKSDIKGSFWLESLLPAPLKVPVQQKVKVSSIEVKLFMSLVEYCCLTMLQHHQSYRSPSDSGVESHFQSCIKYAQDCLVPSSAPTLTVPVSVTQSLKLQVTWREDQYIMAVLCRTVCWHIVLPLWGSGIIKYPVFHCRGLPTTHTRSILSA